jgi:hypothetical protein
MTARTNQLPEVQAKCPECGFRVRISSDQHTQIDPDSLCKHKPWERCPQLRPELSKARQSAQKP